MDRRIRVFLVDDHEVVREGLRRMLERTGDLDVVGEASTARAAAARIPALAPDVALLDVRLSDGSGIDVCRSIRARAPGVACLMLTSYDDDEALTAAVVAGARGYVLKQVRGGDLTDAVRRVARGESILDAATVERVRSRLRNGEGQDARLRLLTQQEQRVLALLSEGLTNGDIGQRLGLAPKTVKNYVSSILAKLGMQRRTQAAVFAAQQLPLRATGRPKPPSGEL
jgi:DNA-binding NarL/FixJ family response regulator